MSSPSPATQAAPAASSNDQQQLESLLDRVLERTERVRGEILLTPCGVEFGNFEGLCRWARYIVASGLSPKGIDTFEKALVCIVLGRSVGLDPFQAIQNIASINGRPVMWGDMPLAVCRQHKDWDESGYEEYFEVAGRRVEGNPPMSAFAEAAKDQAKAAGVKCVVKTLRRGAKEQKVHTFSVADAVGAGLWGKNGSLYGTYPHRMLRFRARGYNLRDNFGDALKGLGVRELADEEESPAALGNGRADAAKARAAAVTAKLDAAQSARLDMPGNAPSQEERDEWEWEGRREAKAQSRLAEAQGAPLPAPPAPAESSARLDAAVQQRTALTQPVAAAAPPERQPGEDIDEDEMTRADMEANLAERLDQAASDGDFQAVGAEMTKHAAFLGTGHARLVARYQERYLARKQGAGAKPKAMKEEPF